MPFTHDFLTSYQFPETAQSIEDRDAILYALGLGIGERPTDPGHLQFTYEKALKAVPTMGVVLAHPGFWAKDPAFGIDWVRMLHGEQGLTVHRPVPVKGKVIGRSRISDVVDRGDGKGAMLYYERDIVDAGTGDLIATSRQTLVCRGNGGFSGVPPKPLPPPHAIPDRAPDRVFEIATLPQMALIYRLSGDLNPLHADPEVATAAGFERPILHGLATYGLGGRALLECACDHDPARLKSFDVRFTSPVFPGETVRVQLWLGQPVVSLRAIVVGRDKVVMDNGRAEIVGA